MRRLIASLSLAGLLSPLAASAQWTMPSQVFLALNDMSSSTTSVEMHVHAEDVYVSVWANGSQQGTFMSPDSRAKWKATIDVVQGPVSVRMKGQMRMNENIVYLKLDTFEGSLDDLLGTFSWSLLQKDWVRIPLGEMLGMGDMPFESMMMQDPVLLTQLDEFFSVSERRFPGGYAYTLTPSPAFLAMLDLDQGAVMDMEIKVDTNADRTPVFASVAIDMSDPVTGMTMRMDGKTQGSRDPVYVEVPKNTISLEELEAHLQSLDFFGSPWVGMPEGVDWMHEGNNWGETDEWNSPSSVMPCMDPNSEEFWNSDWSDEDWIPCESDGTWTDDGWTEEEDTWMEDVWSEDTGIEACGDEGSSSYWSDIDSYWSDEEMEWIPCSSHLDVPTWIDGCMAEPGTPAYVLEIRRGTCKPDGVGRGMIRRSR